MLTISVARLFDRQKRSSITPITYEGGAPAQKKTSKGDLRMYSPPGGKFSEKAGTYTGGEL